MMLIRGAARNKLIYGLCGALMFRAIEALADPIAATVKDVKEKVLCRIVDWGFYIFIVVAVIMVLWAAYIYITSQGDKEKVGTGHRTLAYAAVAIAVAIFAKAFPIIIGSIFVSDTSGWGC
jgi:energy-coupling factor transporter transmembrane protein EcfT